ncbi:MAG: FkbM family methyltransferase, partial [Chitinophagaceae bacterium]
DVGAHYGYFSMFAAANLAPDAAVFSFEPSGKNFAVLQQNIKKSGFANIRARHCAIGGESGKSRLFLGDSVNNSILSDFAMNRANSASEEIEVKTLQQVLDENSIAKVDFLKLDCEGAEYAILQTAPPEVLDKIETISMEFHDMKNAGETGEEIVAILLKNKFEIVKYHYNKTSQGINYGKIIGTKILAKYR